MRHQTRFGRDGLHQVFVNFDGINRTDAKSGQVRNQFKNTHHEIAQLRLGWKVGTPACQVDSGQDDFIKAFVDQALDLINYDACCD